MTKLSYYDYGAILSRNAMYNGVVGGRGLGKTWGAKRRALKDALTKGRQFILLRRYKEELAEAKSTFFADIAHVFPDWELVIVGREARASRPLEEIEGETKAERKQREKEREWITLGYFIPLSIAQRMKSTAYPDVYTIIFDEFIIEKGNIRYLPNEVTAFNNFYATVDRWNDRVKVFFLANSVNIMNPYFLEWGIRPDEENEFVSKFKGSIVFHFPDSAKFQSEVFATRFGQFIQESSPEYAEYAVGNKFSDNHDMLLELKDYTAKYVFTLETSHGVFSVWSAKQRNSSPFNRETVYYVQAKRPREEVFFTLLPEKMSEEKVLMTYRDKPLEALRTAFRTGRLLFDQASTRNAFIYIFERK